MSYFSAISRGEKPALPTWAPFLETLAAQVEGCDLNVMTADATRWSNSLPRVAKLVDTKVIAIGFIDDFGTDSFASRPQEPWTHGPLAALLECTRRLAETVRPDRELMVALPGPASICHRSLGKSMDRSVLDTIKPTLVKLLEMLCEFRPDIVIINEVMDSVTQLATTDYRRMCNTLKNVTEYFGIPLGLRVSGYGERELMISELRILKLDHLMLGQTGMSHVSVPALLAAAVGQGWQSMGMPIESAESIVALPQQGTCHYWCSAAQEQDLEQARTLGLALSVA